MFERLILIGTGRIARGCAEVLANLNLPLTCIEAEQSNFSLVKSFCAQRNLQYWMITERKELSQFFMNISVPSLVVSAHNIYIFPLQVVKNLALKIINLHNSLLPRHPGFNAPSWAIFDMDETSGITWHEVIAEIDRGGIITQSEIPIGERTTALDLTMRCADLAIKSFKEILPSVLPGDYRPQMQHSDTTFKVHHSKDVPNDGMLDLSWDIRKISAFLRAMDYGKLSIFPAPRLGILGNVFTLHKYTFLEGFDEHDRQSITFDPPKLSIISGNIQIEAACTRRDG